MKKRLLILFIALVAIVTINTVYSQREASISAVLKDFIVYQVQYEKDKRINPSPQLRITCSANECKSYLFARIIARYGIEAIVKVLAQKDCEDITLEQIIDHVMDCKDVELPVADCYSPLIHLAARCNNVPMLELILSAGDYINLGANFPTAYYTDTAGCWCFISDINCNYCSIMPTNEILIFPHYHLGYTPLQVAVFAQAKEAVSFLLKAISPLLKSGKTKIDVEVILLALKSFPYAGSQEDMKKAYGIFQMLLEYKTDNKISTLLVWLNKHKPSILKKYFKARYTLEAIEQALNQKACCMIA